MITYVCDQCGGNITPSLRYAVHIGTVERHFCTLICVSGWANKTGVRTPKTPTDVEQPTPQPDAPLRTLIRAQNTVAPKKATTARGYASSTVQDAVEHTCEVCGRTGTRRYVSTPTGWRCAPSSAEACARKAGAKSAPPRPADPQYAHRTGRGLPGQASDIPAKQFQPNVTPPKPEPPTVIPIDRTPPPAPAPVVRTAGLPRAQAVTARCQDCTRTWTLTDRPLQMAVEMHELKHAHIVDIKTEVPTSG
jgi:hypothetical protein